MSVPHKRMSAMAALADPLGRLWARQDGHLREVLAQSGAALAIRIGGTLAGFAVSIAVARLLGARGAGLYFLSLSVVTIVATASRLGFENTVVRFVAAHAAAADWRAVRSVYAGMLKVVVPAALLVSLALVLLAGPLALHVFGNPRLVSPLRVAALAIAPLALLMTQAEALRGLRRIPRSQFIKTVGVSLVTLALLYPMTELWGETGAVAAYAAATVAVAVLAHRWWRAGVAHAGDAGAAASSPVPVRMLVLASAPLLGFTLCDLLIKQAGTVLLGTWGSDADVGIFGVAARVSALLQFPLLALVSILAPKFSGLIRRGEMPALRRLARQCALLLVAFGLPASVLVAAAAAPVMSIFGAQFTPGADVLRILVAGMLVNVVTGPVGTLLMMAGHGGSCLRSSLLGIATLLLSAVFLIPAFGAQGAALATASGLVLQNLAMLFHVRHKLGFWLLPALA